MYWRGLSPGCFAPSTSTVARLTEAWQDEHERSLLAPLFAVSDGAFGFWAAPRQSVPFHQKTPGPGGAGLELHPLVTKTPSLKKPESDNRTHLSRWVVDQGGH